MSTLSAPAEGQLRAIAEARPSLGLLGSAVVAVATAVVLLAVAVLPLLTPAWIHIAMAQSGGLADGASLQESFRLSDLTVNELLLGPGTFAITYAGGRPLYGPDEIGHLQDVRLVLWAFLGAAAVGAVVILIALVRLPQAAAWRAIGRGGVGLAIALAAAGLFAVVAFGAAFELFHRILFPGGNWAFDPRQSNLVSLYPLAFWQLSAAAFGGLGIGAGLVAWFIARRRARAAGPGL